MINKGSSNLSDAITYSIVESNIHRGGGRAGSPITGIPFVNSSNSRLPNQ